MALAVRDEIVDTRHRAVVVHDLADHAGCVQAGEAREVDCGLGLADALEDATGLRAQREHVTGLHEVVRGRVRCDRDLDGPAAVCDRDAGRHPFACLDRHGEGGAERRLVVVGHRAQAELVGALLGQT